MDRALELFDLSIDCAARKVQVSDGGELIMGREVFRDYFLGKNKFNTDPKKLLAYFDQFAIMVRR